MNEIPVAEPTVWGKFCSGCEERLTAWCMDCGAPLCITKKCPRAVLRCHPREEERSHGV